MNLNLPIFLLCPVPENQKPMIEFLIFQENSFFHWITFSRKKYQQKFFSFSISLFFLSFLCAYLFFSFSLEVSTIFLFENFFFFFFFFLYSRWSQIEKRLKSSRLFYEEGSWYDGQVWEKPFPLLKNEKLITTQKIQPILERISFCLFFIFIITTFSFFIIPL